MTPASRVPLRKGARDADDNETARLFWRVAGQGGSVVFDGKYQGSSFYELLQLDYKHLLPPQLAAASLSPTSLATALGQSTSNPIPHGTTVLAMKYDQGVLVAGDRLATAGHSVASRDVVKVYATDAHSVMAVSGAAGPSIEMARILSVELEHYEKIEGEGLELEGKANKLSQMLRQNLPAAMQGLAVVPLFAGYDARRKEGRLWKYDITGGRYEETEFDATGSGGLFAREALKHSWSSDIDRDSAVTLAVEALTAAADEDRATGGVDLERRIFPVVKICSSSGIDEGTEEQIEQAYRAVLARRGNSGGGSQ